MTPSATSWKLPFNLAVLTHVLILASAVIVPKYLHKKPVIPEFLSVDLVNVAAPLPPSTPPAPTPPQAKQAVAPPKPPPPVVPKKTAPIVPITPAVAEASQPPPAEAISIQPLKRKVKVEIPEDNTQKIIREREARDAERIRQQLLQDARRQKALAEAEAAAANDAVKALRHMLQADSVSSGTREATQPSTTRPGGNANTVIENQYNATIESSLSQHWALPEIKPWNPDLSARVIIHIAKDGKIISHSFEKRSGDRVFDQFVSRTIHDANPLPPIPGAMKVSEYRIGLHFTPGQIR